MLSNIYKFGVSQEYLNTDKTPEMCHLKVLSQSWTVSRLLKQCTKD